MMEKLREWYADASLQQKQALFIGGGALVLAILIGLIAAVAHGSGSSSAAATADRTVKLVCQNPACRYEFKMSPDEARTYVAKHNGESIKCPKCGSTDIVQEGSGGRGQPTEEELVTPAPKPPEPGGRRR